MLVRGCMHRPWHCTALNQPWLATVLVTDPIACYLLFVLLAAVPAEPPPLLPYSDGEDDEEYEYKLYEPMGEVAYTRLAFGGVGAI